MAEERILIARSTDYTISDTKDGALFEGKIAPHNANVFSRQEAIEKMNKAACKANKRCIGGICETCTSKMPHEEYTHQNEAALNALLEGR